MGLVKNYIDFNKNMKACNLLNSGGLDYPNRDEESINSFIKLLSTKEDKEIFDFDATITNYVFNLDARIYADEIYDYEDDSEIPADDFLAVRCGAIAMGENYYLDVKYFRKQLDKENKFPELLKLPARAWAIKHGKTAEEYPFESPNKVETFTDKEAWEKYPDNLSLETRFTNYMEEKDLLRFFAKKVVENEEVWVGVEKKSEESEGFLSFSIKGDSRSLLPVWPTKELADIYFKSDTDDDYKAVAINLFYFLEEVVPFQLSINSLPGAFFTLENYLEKGWSSLKRVIIRELLCGQNQKDADPRLVFNALGRGELGEESANYAFNRLIEKDMDFDEREIKALVGSASLKTIAEYSVNGWPTNCDICGVAIDYSEDWDVAFNQRIVCSDCFEKYEKDNISPRILLDDENVKALENLQENGYNEKKNIDILRKTFEENKDWRADKITKPDWADKEKQDPMFDDAPKLYDEGKIVYGCVYMVNTLLYKDFEPGDSISHPGYITYSMDPYYDDHAGELIQISQAIYSYRDKKIVPIEMQKFVTLMENEFAAYYNVPVPLELTNGREVFVTVSLFQRNHLPMLKINGSILPVFADNEKFSTCLLVPKRHWSKEMMFYVATPEEEEDEEDDE